MRRNRTDFGTLMAKVQDAIDVLEEADEAVASTEQMLTQKKQEREEAVKSLALVRDDLFKAYPELAGAVPQVQPNPVSPDTGFEKIEVDDADDPRYTSGIGGTATGKIEFEER